MEQKAFKEEEIPYGILEQFGLNQEMVEDLPMVPFETILAGRRSPVLPISFKAEDGRIISSRTRFMLIRQEDGSVNVLFAPQLEHSDIAQYSQEQQNQLKEGKAIVAPSPKDGSTQCFVQVDPGTNQVLFIPTPVIGRNLRVLMDNHRLSSAEIQMIQAGEPMTFMEGDEMVTAGIDLTEKTGIRMELGDAQKWINERQDGMDSYNFGLYGCWVKDENGDLSYIHEDDYTEEIWDIQKKVVAQNSRIKR